MLTQAELKSNLHYDQNTGVFTRLKNNSILKINGNNKYYSIYVCSNTYLSHRLAWLYVYGNFPNGQIDHIDGNRSNNRIENLRECNNAENNQNRKNPKNSLSKYIGVSWLKSNKKWRAQIYLNYKQFYLGCFDTEIEAFNAYCKAKAELHTFNPLVRM